MSEQKNAIEAVLQDKGLTMDAKFVPFSQSRNKDQKHKSLNWIVSLSVRGREIIKTDYSQGIGHTPAYASDAFKFENGKPDAFLKAAAEALEAETGMVAKRGYGYTVHESKEKIAPPSIADVVYCFTQDYDVLDYVTYDEWCRDFGFDKDSRKGEAVYRACLEQALKLRANLGDNEMRELQKLFEGY